MAETEKLSAYIEPLAMEAAALLLPNTSKKKPLPTKVTFKLPSRKGRQRCP